MKRKISLMILLCHSGVLFAATWNSTTSPAAWRVNGNWTSPSVFPDATDAVAIFGSVITAAEAVTLSAGVTVGTINFDNANAYTVGTIGQTITFDVSSGNASINVSTAVGAHSIIADLSLSDNLVVTQNSSSTFTISGAISGASKSVTKSGTGTLVLSGDNSAGFSGGLTLQAGTLSIAADSALGLTGTAITISGGTLQSTANISTSRAITLSGAGTFDTFGQTLTLSGAITSTGSLTVSSSTGSGTLVLSNVNNNYSGGTTVGPSSELKIGFDSNLGATSGGLALNSGKLTPTNSLSSARAVSLTGTNTFNVGTTTLTLTGIVSGSGSLTVTGSTGALILTGTNNYSGGNTVTGGTLQGNTASIIGDIVDNAAVVFDQSTNGTYSGVISGTGTLTKQNSGTLTLTGTNTVSGATSVTAGTLSVTGSLSSSAVTVSSGAILTGSGTVGAVTNNGTISNVNASSTLTISGNLTSAGNSTTSVTISPGSSGKIAVTGTANLNGTLQAKPQSGFYGLSSQFTVLTAGTVAGTFTPPVSVTDTNFTATVQYTGTSVILTLNSLKPFFDFPFSNKNTERVGDNINALAAAGTLAPDTDLSNVINTFIGLSNSAINAALDQMHPAQISAIAELQFEVGGHLLSIFHHRPFLICSCTKPNRVWVEPYGNWLHRKSQGEELGFHATTRGVAFGLDGELLEGWTLGFGGAWNVTDLKWSNHRGYAYANGLFGSIYTDYLINNFYVGASVYGGNDWYHTHRHIDFTTIDRHADANFSGLDLAGQLTTAYYFGTPVGFIYPYGTVDYLYLRSHAFKEKGADSLDLSVNVYRSRTLRSEAGIALQTTDKNYNESICISPFVAFGWALEKPLKREDFVSTFANQTIPFKSQGWKESTQLINLKFGLGLTYRCLTLDSQYLLDISPDGGSPFFNQRANFRFNFNF